MKETLMITTKTTIHVDMDKIVEKFLKWPLPSSVCCDFCATKPGVTYRSGTNLLSATEAKQMFEYILDINKEEPTNKIEFHIGDTVYVNCTNPIVGIITHIDPNMNPPLYQIKYTNTVVGDFNESMLTPIANINYTPKFSFIK